MVDSRAGKLYDEPGIFYCVRKSSQIDGNMSKEYRASFSGLT